MPAGSVRSFKALVAAKAEGVAKTFTGEPVQIQELVDDHDLVFGVWEDDQQEDGFDILIIKGRVNFIFGRLDTSQPWTSIPCTSAAQAEAIQLCVKTGVKMG